MKILRHQMHRKSSHFLSLKKKKRVYFHHTYEPFSKASTIAKLLCVRIDLVSNLSSYTRKKGEVLIQYKFYVTILKIFFIIIIDV